MTDLAQLHALPTDITEQEWEDQGFELANRVTSTCWDVGDWLNAGEAKWGERYKRAAEITGLAEQTLRNYASVARAFQLSRRKYKLSFGHYALVAAIPGEAVGVWLKIAEAEGFSVRDLQKALPAQRPPGRPEVVVSVFKITVPTEHEDRWRQAAGKRGLEVEDWLVAVADEASA